MTSRTVFGMHGGVAENKVRLQVFEGNPPVSGVFQPPPSPGILSVGSNRSLRIAILSLRSRFQPFDRQPSNACFWHSSPSVECLFSTCNAFRFPILLGVIPVGKRGGGGRKWTKNARWECGKVEYFSADWKICMLLHWGGWFMEMWVVTHARLSSGCHNDNYNYLNYSLLSHWQTSPIRGYRFLENWLITVCQFYKVVLDFLISRNQSLHSTRKS